jgi:hypothetical protein
MTEKKEYQGYFHTPETPDKKISGVLFFYPNEKIRLELIGGCLSGTANGFFCKHEEIKAIFGVVKTDNGVSNVTLLNCYGSGGKSHNNLQDCSICLTNYSCSYLLIGKHLTDKEDKVFNKIRVSFPCFNDWYNDNKILLDCENDFTAIFKTTNNHKNSPKIQLNQTETLIINGYSSHYNINRHEKCLYEKSYIELENTEKSKLFDLLVNIGWFKDFYSFASMSAMPFSEVYLYDYDDFQEIEKGIPKIKSVKEKFYNPVSLFYVAEERFEKKDKFFNHHFLFDFQKIENNFEAIMQKWYENKENSEPIIQQLISSVTYRRFIKSSDFLIVIQAIEGYSNRFERESDIPKANDKLKQPSLQDRLNHLYSKYSDIQIIENNKPSLEQVIDSRHYYSHFLPDGKKKNVCKSWDLYGLAEKLKPLLISCILTLMGFKNEDINELLSKYYEWSGNSFISIK